MYMETMHPMLAYGQPVVASGLQTGHYFRCMPYQPTTHPPANGRPREADHNGRGEGFF